MNTDQLELMRKALPEKLLQSTLIGEALSKFWEETPIKPEEDFDLNPHLYIVHICEQVAQTVIDSHVPCTKEDVMLYWLTMAIYGNMFLPQPKT